jgi:hypothetical protein
LSILGDEHEPLGYHGGVGRVWLLVIVMALGACQKEQARPPAPRPALIVADAAVADTGRDSPPDARLDTPVDASVEVPADAVRAVATQRCSPTECWLPDENRCAIPSGPLNGGVCGSPGGVCNRCRCAAPWTPIETPSGPRPIAELRAGDLVLSTEGGAVISVPIARTNRVVVTGHHATSLTFDDGTQLLISAEHPLADGRMFGAVAAGERFGSRRVVRSELVTYPLDATHDILPASSSGVYFSRGIALGSTLR